LLGALLAVSWFTVLVGRRWVVVTLTFIFFGGLDVLGHVLLHRQMCPVTGHQEWWAYFWQYSSNTALLFWVPQHAIAGWIIPAVLLYESLYQRHSSNSAFLFALSVLWSPLVSAGLVPFMALALMQTRLKHAWSLQNLLFAPLLLAIVGLYFSSHSQGVGRGWLWEITDLRADWPRLFSFYLLEFGVYVAVAWGALSQLPSPLKAWWLVALAALLVFPFYVVGEWNDFAMRASIPTLFVFWLGVGKALVGSHTRMGAVSRAALAVALIIGALGPGSELARSLINQPWRVRDPFGQVVLMTNPPAAQYLGMPDSPFFKQLARELEPVPPHTRLPLWRLESVRSGPARRLC
jgi:hypothetical protein